MKSTKIKSEIMLRIRDKRLLDKLQEMYDGTKYESVNEFLNAVLKTAAFKDTKEDEIILLLENVDDKTNAIFEGLQHGSFKR